MLSASFACGGKNCRRLGSPAAAAASAAVPPTPHPSPLVDISKLPGEAVICHEGRCSVSVSRKHGSFCLMAAGEESCDETAVVAAAGGRGNNEVIM